jgi:hypothetical protein
MSDAMPEVLPDPRSGTRPQVSFDVTADVSIDLTSEPGPSRNTLGTPARNTLGTPALSGAGGRDSCREEPLTGQPPDRTLSDRTLSDRTLSDRTLSDRTLSDRTLVGCPKGESGVRRGPVDPVKVLMHRHAQLCERAVDSLEIAAGLEAHGITDRTAARFRHRDVFSLADELYARVPRGTGGAPGEALESSVPPVADGRRSTGWSGWAGWAALSLLPGIVGVVALAGLERTSGQSQLAIALAGAMALSAALSGCLGRGPLRAEGRTVPAAGLWVYWLLSFAVCGDGLLEQLVAGGPHGPWPASLTPLLALAFAVAPAAFCAQLFSVRARRRLDTSHGLADFAAATRPLLFVTVGLFAAALAGLAWLSWLAFGDGGGGLAATVSLGALLLLARLLTVHGYPGPAATGLAVACAGEALCCVSVLAGRVPGFAVLAAPVRDVVQAWGAGAVPALACGAAALGLLAHAAVALARASAHT